MCITIERMKPLEPRTAEPANHVRAKPTTVNAQPSPTSNTMRTAAIGRASPSATDRARLHAHVPNHALRTSSPPSRWQV